MLLPHGHAFAVTKLSKKLVQSEAERTEAQAEVDDIRQRLSEIKHKHESILIENTTKVALEDHVISVSELKRLVIFCSVKSSIKKIKIMLNIA